MADSAKDKPVSDPLEEGRNRLRETIKWLVASFGAIGASLAIGSQLSNIGSLSAGRLSLAVIGAVAAFGGILLAIWIAVKVMTGSHITLGQLAKESREAKASNKRSAIVTFFEVDNRSILEKYDSLADLDEAWEGATRGADEVEYRRVGGIVKAVINVAGYEQLRSKFDDGLRGIMGGVALAVAGIILFAWSANPGEAASTPRSTTSVLAVAPVRALISLTPEGSATLGDDLGAECGPSDIPAIVVAADRDGLDVITLPTVDCQLLRLQLTPELGILLAAEPVCRPSPRPASSPSELVCRVP
jgi:hypothetical protein